MQAAQEQKNPVISFLESDITLNIAILLSFLGLIVMAVFTCLLQGMARVHMGVVTFLFTGLCLSLVYFKGLKSEPKLNSGDQPSNSKQQKSE